jgi:nicotinamidase-related amidase
MKVLMIVDMQNGFIDNEKYFLLNKKITTLIKEHNYDKYIFTQFINDKSQNPLYQKMIGYNKLTTPYEQDFSIDLPDNAILIKKYGYSLSLTDLGFIKSLNISEIDICGIKAEACVYAISLQLWDNNIFPNLLINYIEGDVDMKEIYIHQFGKITQ